MKKGMTLVELMVVVAIIALLVTAITVFLRTQVFKANDAKRKAEIKRIGIAVEEYEKDNDCYPLPSLVVCSPGTGLMPYIDKIPCDPITKASYMYDHEDSTCPKWYKIYSKLDNTTDVDYQTAIGPNSSYSYVYGSPNAPVDVSGQPTSAPTGGGGTPPPEDNFYGCFSGVCLPINWDPSRPGPECDPNFQNIACYNQCVNPENECTAWQN
ncbi:hypothetical protein A2130_00675 [Candidatus Woesebacteria bacterium GWC2_33_12]|uniref:Type II secretion system protein G n=1 Tax=Candidatus Woesebacteria bacterium GW2011_GWB1_33_22 TaxID=1618566 RepID=A0A0F9ZLZ0_9BACT|nr:MAG: hypothetical protein UR29_C0002G0028 [Candidatus Woesebacteria bacterium GW2011_GWC2_33_12]KKP42500.1 MAG: hypothetical protein UR33_C0002G0076 [Candidatus Woesebacteria bacterium GW2011_GWA2_33_20]KKP45243.1 MAG: hypothetical protein UR35_C0002G0076 [Candidatus Woesebacteria bacterium GW2011_GWB1_33_22]KKP46462.1 MAG: hypothetical protein UR37_C0007G0019 [Microgenomates group bacterium GW2011_GWC1_33_28]KKP50913.1 MAG: hypothetical protein UR41_C0002G0077 [Candidatus Woesebacteria bact